MRDLSNLSRRMLSDKIDADENAECLFGLDDNAKLERVRGRLEYILKTGRVFILDLPGI